MEIEFERHYQLFNLTASSESEGNCPEWPLYRSTAAIALLKERASTYGGLPSISHFIRAFGELKKEGAIRQLRQPKPPEPEDHDLTAAEYNKLSAREITTRYRSQPDFRSQVDALIKNGLIALLFGVGLLAPALIHPGLL